MSLTVKIRKKPAGKRTVAALEAHPENPRQITDEQLQRLDKAMDAFGDLGCIIFNRRFERLVGGHQRTKTIPQDAEVVIERTFDDPSDKGTVAEGYIEHRGERFKYREVDWDEPTEVAAMLAANKHGGGWDMAKLSSQLLKLDHLNIDLDLTGFSEVDLANIMAPTGPLPGDAKTGGMLDYGPASGNELKDAFVVPPFTVLDTRQGYWQDRKAQWLLKTGNLTETKEGVLGSGNLVSTINEGSSNFDPVLAELIMKWFSVPGGKILDPFGGEQTKGVVAGELGYPYHAVEFRRDQVDVNRAATAKYGNVHYKHGDSNDISTLIGGNDFDLCFTSPPYYDLEVYSKDDMSSLGTYEEFMVQYERIFAQCVAMLKEDRFLVVKVGEIRSKKTGVYRNFVGDNIAMFIKLGLAYYNELVLVNAVGTAQLRAARSMRNRKVTKLHQNVLVFYKGNPKNVGKHFPVLEMPTSEEDATASDADSE